MRFISLSAGGPWGSMPWRRLHNHHRNVRTNASSSASSSGRGSYFDRVKGIQGPLKAALTSGSLSATGDLLAQFATGQIAKSEGRSPAPFDPTRTARMFGFGLCFYGPYQFYWYNLLEYLMPVRNSVNFLTKVAANQLLLAPVTLSAVFSWNLSLTGRSQEVPDKLKQDLVPTMMNGWKFWIPAASINFYAVPLEYQVLYMSACGVLWTAYLSYASVTQMSSTAVPAPAAAAPLAASAKESKRR